MSKFVSPFAQENIFAVAKKITCIHPQKQDFRTGMRILTIICSAVKPIRKSGVIFVI
jgi:hypothetical protein